MKPIQRVQLKIRWHGKNSAKTANRSSSPRFLTGVNKSKLIEQIASLVNEKRVEGIGDIRDESDRDGMRIVFELKAQ